ncbi:hypothetical protein GGI12_000254 [Dipsacomyces acuminosporus]|nr:hypothetical protein GGI12_000254 [Dipsacomyces acuminosporus]
MPNPFNIVAFQSQKGHLSEEEQQALARARFRLKLYSLVGGAAGAGLGYYLSRRNKSLPMRGFMIFFNSAFLFSVASSYASFTGLRDLSDPNKYPHIVAAMKDISQEILRSRGVDPAHPELGRAGTVPHKPNFKSLPPSMTEEEKSAVKSDESMFYTGFSSPPESDTQQQRQHAQESGVAQPSKPASAWDAIRTSDGRSENAWDRLRKQQQQQQQQQQPRNVQASASPSQQLEDAWSKLNQSENDSLFSDRDSSSTSSRGFDGRFASSDDFPRSREDFEQSSQGRTTKYGDSAYS